MKRKIIASLRVMNCLDSDIGHLLYIFPFFNFKFKNAQLT